MSVTSTSIEAAPRDRQPPGRGGTRPRRPRTSRRVEVMGAWTLSAPYLLLLLVAGVIPIGYAVITALQTPPTPLDPGTGFGGLRSFTTIVTDFRFARTFVNIGSVLIIWLPIMLVGIVGLALLVHASVGRFGSAMRFLYYVPGALGGVANFVLWVYLLNPDTSPIRWFWSALGLHDIKSVVVSGNNLPAILAAMLFFQGVGTWIVIVNGGLNGIDDAVLEAAEIDGAGPWRVAWYVKLPIIRPWIGYAALMNLAYGFQLFLEPQLLDQVASNALPDQYSPSQLGFAFAFSNYNFPAAAAMSLIQLAITLGIGLLIVFRSGLFAEEEH